MKPGILLGAAVAMLALNGCRPADSKPKSVRERVLAGETVTFSKTGYSLCGNSMAWNEMRVSNQEERSRIILRKQSSVLNPGRSACYRVGDNISLGVLNQRVRNGGTVRIDRISLVLLDKLEGDQMRGRFFASQDNFETYRDGLLRRMKPDMENVITIVDFTYVANSAQDEADLRQKDSELDQTGGYEETTQDGDYLPGTRCKAPYSYISAPADLQNLFATGVIKSWYEFGDRSCLQQGQTVDLSPGKNLPSLGRVKITKVKRFHLSAIAPAYFTLGQGYDYATLLQRIRRENTRDSEWIVVADFEMQPTPSTNRGQP